VRVPDVTSGFRAYSRHAALRVNVFSKFTYTLETVIQAGREGMAIAHVPVQANPPTRPSRLFSSIGDYVQRSIGTMVRIYALYEPLRAFTYTGLAVSLTGLLGMAAYAVARLRGDDGHLAAFLMSGVLVVIGSQLWMLAVIADLVSVNRRLKEEVVTRLRRRESERRRPSNEC
jgi:hypothetical protein